MLHLRATMPRFYPEKDCDLYVEKLIDFHFDSNPQVLRKDPFINAVRWFQDQDDKEDVNRSIICSWGIGETFEKNTGWNGNCFIKSRLRKCCLPSPGRRGLWKITQTGPAGMCCLPLHMWDIQDWLKNSSFKSSNSTKIKK